MVVVDACEAVTVRVDAAEELFRSASVPANIAL
jgi:hypothetical protein